MSPIMPSLPAQGRMETEENRAAEAFETLKAVVSRKPGQAAQAFSFFVSSISSLSDEQKAKVCEKLMVQVPKNEAERKFLYQALCLVAPYKVASDLRRDVSMPASDFRAMNGGYEVSDNNCRHYLFKKYYAIFKNSMHPELKTNLYKEGENNLPENFDWKRTSDILPKIKQNDYENTSKEGRETFAIGINIGFVRIDITDDKQIKNMLKPGDLVWVRTSPNTESYYPHVGGYCGSDFKNSKGTPVEIPIVNIARPLAATDYPDFVKRTRSKGGEVYILRWAGTYEQEGKKYEPEFVMKKPEVDVTPKDRLRMYGSIARQQ